jgi:hypothetical protein
VTKKLPQKPVERPKTPEDTLRIIREIEQGKLHPCPVFRDAAGNIVQVNTWQVSVAFQHLIGRPDGWGSDEEGARLWSVSTLMGYLVRVAIHGTPEDWRAVEKMHDLMTPKPERQALAIDAIARFVHEYHHAPDGSDAIAADILKSIGCTTAPYSEWRPTLAFAVHSLWTQLGGADVRFFALDPDEVKYWVCAFRPTRDETMAPIRERKGGASNSEPPLAAAHLSLLCGAFDARQKEGESFEDARERIATSFRNALKRVKPRV